MPKSSIAEKVKQLFTGPELETKLEDLNRQLAAARDELEELRQQHAATLTDAAIGYPDAKGDARRLAEKISGAEERVRNLTIAAEGVRAKIADANAEAAHQAAAKVPARIEAAHKAMMAAARRADARADELVTALRDAFQAGQELAAVIGTEEARRLFGSGAFKARLAALINKFAIWPEKPGTRAMADNWSFFDFKYTAPLSWLKRSLPDLVQEALDAAVPVYLDQKDAEAAQARLAKRGEEFVVLPGPPPAGGFVLRPPRHSGGEAA